MREEISWASVALLAAMGMAIEVRVWMIEDKRRSQKEREEEEGPPVVSEPAELDFTRS